MRTKLLLVFLLLQTVIAQAQCAMCRAALQSEGDTLKAEAVNDGIVYLMAIPYILVGGVMYYVWHTRKSAKS